MKTKGGTIYLYNLYFANQFNNPLGNTKETVVKMKIAPLQNKKGRISSVSTGGTKDTLRPDKHKIIDFTQSPVDTLSLIPHSWEIVYKNTDITYLKIIGDLSLDETDRHRRPIKTKLTSFSDCQIIVRSVRGKTIWMGIFNSEGEIISGLKKHSSWSSASSWKGPAIINVNE